MRKRAASDALACFLSFFLELWCRILSSICMYIVSRLPTKSGRVYDPKLLADAAMMRMSDQGIW